MTKINLFMNILFLLITIILCAIPRCLSALSDKRLCYDPDCSVPVSLARTILPYNSNDHQIMSFRSNVNVTVYSKAAGNRTDLWGVEINGKRGYVPKRFLNEYKILKNNLTYKVSTFKFNQENNSAQVSKDSKTNKNDALNLSLKDNEKSSSTNDDISIIKSADGSVEQSVVNKEDISPTYKVIEGTTVHFENNETTLEPSFVSQSVQATPVPSEQPSEDFTLSTNSLTENLDSKQKQIHNGSFDETKDILKNFEQKDNVDEAQNTVPLPDINLTSKNLSDMDHKIDHKSDSNLANKNDIEGAKESSESNNKSYVEESTEKEKEKDSLKKGYVKKAKATDKIENNVHPLGMILSEKVKKQELENLKIENNIEHAPTTSESNLEEVEKSVNNIDVKAVESQIVKESSVQEEKEVPKNEETEKEMPVDTLEGSSNQVPDTSVQEEVKETFDTSIESIPLSAENNSISGQDHIIDAIPTDANEELTKVEEKEKIETSNQNFTEDTVSDTSNKINVDRNLQETTALNIDPIDNQEITVNSTVNSNNNLLNNISSFDVPIETNEFSKDISDKITLQEQEQLDSSQVNVITEQISNLKEFQHNRNLLNVEENVEIENTGYDVKSTVVDINESLNSEALPEYGDDISNEDKVSYTSTHSNDIEKTEEIISRSSDVCMTDGDCQSSDTEKEHEFLQEDKNSEDGEETIMTRVKMKQNYWETFMYLGVTAFTALFFSLGYYFIENKRRDGELIAKINKLEKELLVSMKECTILSESLKTTKEKLNSIEDESFGSNEMVLSLKADLEVSQNTKAELEDQVVMLEKDLESATEAGLELERMLREVLSSNNEVNPLAKSVEDLQIRLNVQQAANESLTNALNLKTQENESLSADLTSMKQKFEELEVELMQVSENLKAEINLKTNLEHTSTDKIQQLEFQVQQLTVEKLALQKDLKGKIAEVEDLAEVVNQVNSNNIDLNKLYDVSHIKAEATQLLEERDELKVQLSEVEGAHHLLEEHMKLIKEEISALSDQCKQAEKEKKDAETRLEVLSNFFKEKETQRQKEEAIWLQKQGEVMSTVERIQTLQNELQNYKQQIEMLKREIVDQEREYKSQISLLETKAHEQWVIARQNERRLEESKTEAAQLRNRLTMIEKNLNEADPDPKLHRLETNGETATSPPLFIGAESSSSPIMFTGSSGVPPPPPLSYMHCSMFPPYLPPPLPSGSGVPPYEVGQRPPPLGGRLSSPPPMPLHPPASSRYDNTGSPPPPMSPHLLPPFNRHRSPPPPFGNDHIHPPPPPPPGSILPPPLGTSHSWGEESLPPLRNSGFHPHQREQRTRNHKGSLHSSGESLDKTHHSGKV